MKEGMNIANSEESIEFGKNAMVFHHNSRKEGGELVIAPTEQFKELLQEKSKKYSEDLKIHGFALLDQLDKIDVDIPEEHRVNILTIIREADFLDRQKMLDDYNGEK